MAYSNLPDPDPSSFRTILVAALTGGILDMLGAIIVYVLIMKRLTTTKLLQGIARGAFGKSAYEGGRVMALAGLGLHFIIALLFALFYFFIFPFVPFLKRQRIVSGLLYGIFVWCIMNLAVLPLLHIANIPMKWDVIARGSGILMVCIGLPISLIVSRYYIRKHARPPRKTIE